MADIEAPGGYFVGRPVNYEQKAQPALEDEKVNAEVPGYYAGRVHGKKTAAGDQSSASEVQPNRDPGFLARWFACFSGSGNAK
ncbi:unnamed protein product [Urochloa decumbens]|uniref:Uncharacterized protein n=1 Tax=Urochloa decumbens TaxID=240449 RepID=A0ABC9AZD2_9POAL